MSPKPRGWYEKPVWVPKTKIDIKIAYIYISLERVMIRDECNRFSIFEK